MFAASPDGVEDLPGACARQVRPRRDRRGM